jgi:hypothetical protein
MQETEGNRVCSNCGRIQSSIVNRCPNCGYDPAAYSQAYTAEGYAVSAETAVPRWLLLVGSILLLSVLVYLVAPRDGGGRMAEDALDRESGSGTVLAPPRPIGRGFPAAPPDTMPRPTASARLRNAPHRNAPHRNAPHRNAPPIWFVSPKPTPDADAEFWRRKAARELREATEQVPTREEIQAREYFQWQNHIGITNESRAADFVTRRTPPAGGW